MLRKCEDKRKRWACYDGLRFLKHNVVVRQHSIDQGGRFMELSHRQDLSLHHGLHLTTELKQGISVLQMSALDLSEYVRSCVEENPFFDEEYVEVPKEASADHAGDSDVPGLRENGKRTWDVSTEALIESRGHGSPENFGNERKDMSQRTFSFDRFLAESEISRAEAPAPKEAPAHDAAPASTPSASFSGQSVSC